MDSFFSPVTNLLVACLALGYSQQASCNDEAFRHYGREDGLSHLSVTSIFQDSRGVMWIGTRVGLNCFDGRNIKCFYPNTKDANSIGSATINSIVESKDSLLWIGTSKGCSVFDYRSDTYRPLPATRQPISGNVTDVVPDGDGNMWVIDSFGLHKISADKDKSLFFRTSNSFIPSKVLCTRAGRIWVASCLGDLFSYNQMNHQFTRHRILDDSERECRVLLNNLVETQKGTLFITTQHDGARLFDPNTNKVTCLFTADDENRTIFIHTLLYEANDEIALGTEGGVYVYRIGKGFTKHITSDSRSESSLASNAVHALFRDIEGGTWIGTYFGGVNYLPDNAQDFKVLLPENSDGSFSARVIREMVSDDDGHMWIGTEDGGLCMYNISDSTFQAFDRLEYNGKRITRNIQSLLIQDRLLWFGTFDEGLYLYDISKSSIIRHYGSSSAEGSISNNCIVQIFDLGNGKMLIGTISGLYLFDSTKGLFSLIRGLEFQFVHNIYQLNDKTILIATLGSGLFRLTRQADGFVAEKLRTDHEDLCTIFEDTSHRLWLGTNTNGLFLYDVKQQKTMSFDANLSRPNIAVYKVLEDGNGLLWISTSDGLFSLNKNTSEVIRYGLHNALPTDQFNFNSGYQDAKGCLFFGSLKGLITFNPSAIHHQKKNLHVYFMDIERDGNSFSVNFSVPVFSSNQSVWLRYRLEGVDGEWLITQGRQAVKYNNLAPGDYKLCVEASTTNGLWAGDYSYLDIHIPYPPFSSPLAVTIYCLAAVCLIVFIIYKYKRKILEKRMVRMEAMRHQVETEALNSKIKFFTDITHEIRTPLTLIIGSLDRLKKHGGQGNFTGAEELATMRNNSNRLLNLVNQLLDFRKVESSSYAMVFNPIDVNKQVSEVFSTFVSLAEEKGIEFSLETSSEHSYAMADREAFTKVVTNMIGNALKYCSKRTKVKIESSEEGNGKVIVKTVNDGSHIPVHEQDNIFKPFHQVYDRKSSATINGTGLGLALARNLAELQNGSLTYDGSTEDNIFIFTLPIHITEESPEQPLDSSRPTVLLVDDEQELRKFVSQDLSERYNVIQAGNGAEALRMLEENTINIIVTDVMMPMMDGIELCKRVKAELRFCHIPVIVLTAKVSLQDHLEALSSKSDAYIEKPFQEAELLMQIDNLLANRHLICSAYSQSPYALTDNIVSNDLDKKFLKDLSQFITESISNPELSVEFLAANANMSMSTFYRKVKGLTSMSPQEFIRYSRLKRAAELLSVKDKPIKQVAEDTGFSSVAYFNSCFMKQFGVTPGKFRSGNL